MQTLVDMEDEQLKDLMLKTNSQNATEAILKAVQEYLQHHQTATTKQYSFIGIANSGKGNISEKASNI